MGATIHLLSVYYHGGPMHVHAALMHYHSAPNALHALRAWLGKVYYHA